MSYIDSHEPQPWIGDSNIVDRFGLGDTGSPRRKRGRGMSATLGGI